MRLTNVIRETFVDRVMDAVPIKHQWNDQEARRIASAAALAAAPADVKRFLKKYPGGVILVSTDIVLVPEGDENVPGARYRDITISYRRPIMVPESSLDFSALIAQYRGHCQEDTARAIQRSSLERIVNGCTTLKALHEALPDLKHLMPGGGQPQGTAAGRELIAGLIKSGLKVNKGAAK